MKASSSPSISTGDPMTQTLSESQPLHAARPFSLPLRFPERRWILFLGDVLLLLCAGVAALATWAALSRDVAFNAEFVTRNAVWLVGLSAAWLVLWAVNGGYDLGVAAQVRAVNRRLLLTAFSLGLIYLVLFFLLSSPPALFQPSLSALSSIPLLRLLPMLFIVFALVAELAWRNLCLRVLTAERFQRRTMVVGAGWAGRTIAQILHEYGGGAYEIVGFVDDDPAKQGGSVSLEVERQSKPITSAPGDSSPACVLGDCQALPALIARHGVCTLVLAITHEVDGALLQMLLDCLELGVEIVPMPELYEQLTGRVPIEHMGGNWYVAMPIQHPATGSLYRIMKRLMDIVLASLGLVCLGLALPIIAAAIYLDSPGPILYTQERVGKGGRIFRAYKFRSMVADAEKGGQALWAAKHDPRVTRVGRILRKTHVDEFPQFLNILKGEMSAVGPRPERPEFVEELVNVIPFYRVRHAVKPGMAGWGLVKQGYGASKEDAFVKLQYDLYYIKHQSLWLDTLILLRTVADTLTLGGR